MLSTFHQLISYIFCVSIFKKEFNNLDFPLFHPRYKSHLAFFRVRFKVWLHVSKTVSVILRSRELQRCREVHPTMPITLQVQNLPEKWEEWFQASALSQKEWRSETNTYVNSYTSISSSSNGQHKQNSCHINFFFLKFKEIYSTEAIKQDIRDKKGLGKILGLFSSSLT